MSATKLASGPSKAASHRTKNLNFWRKLYRKTW